MASVSPGAIPRCASSSRQRSAAWQSWSYAQLSSCQINAGRSAQPQRRWKTQLCSSGTIAVTGDGTGSRVRKHAPASRAMPTGATVIGHLPAEEREHGRHHVRALYRVHDALALLVGKVLEGRPELGRIDSILRVGVGGEWEARQAR